MTGALIDSFLYVFACCVVGQEAGRALLAFALYHRYPEFMASRRARVYVILPLAMAVVIVGRWIVAVGYPL